MLGTHCNNAGRAAAQKARPALLARPALQEMLKVRRVHTTVWLV